MVRGTLPYIPGVAASGRWGAGLTAATNDIGIITLPDGRHPAVAVFLVDSRADDATRDAIIAGVTEAAWRAVARS
ncbi:MAG TPA: hypothetical protein VFS11_00635 [Gemmatimonadales bacterium]|nr:hypothetical protein [Gemmatimonadales bacterium]